MSDPKPGTQFQRKPLIVDALRFVHDASGPLTLEQFAFELAEWCGGKVQSESPQVPPRIEIRHAAGHTITARQGEWIVKDGTNAEVFSDEDFRRAFDPLNKIRFYTDERRLKVTPEIWESRSAVQIADILSEDDGLHPYSMESIKKALAGEASIPYKD